MAGPDRTARSDKAERFGPYELIERIAVGGMAEVFIARAVDRAQQAVVGVRPLIVKRMLAQLAESDEHITMFLDEARLGTALRHPCIVEVKDVGQIELAEPPSPVDGPDPTRRPKAWYMALEYVDGPDLGQVLKTARDARSPLPQVYAAYIIARAAEGLHFAHDAVDPKTGAPLQLVHRDVSPQNILVSRSGDVKVADFGVAKTEVQLHQTRAGIVKGKVAYMAPEQIAAGKIDRRTDVLALGVSLWEAATHKRMYTGANEVEVMKKVYFDAPPLPSTVASIDPMLEAIIMKALARRPDERQQSAQELMEDLDTFIARQLEAHGGDGPPLKERLAGWMQQRFIPRAVIADVATSWAWKSPAHGSEADGAPLDPLEATAAETVDAPDLGALGGIGADPTEIEGAPVLAGGGAPVDSSSNSSGERTADKTADKSADKTADKSADESDTKRKRPLKPLGRATSTKSAARDLVLYVEDEESNWRVAELRLQKNYELLHAADDQSACELLRKRGRELAAILMDIQLKGSQLDGIQLVRLIRGSLALSEVPSYARGVPTLGVPIFFVTAYAARYTERELLAVGADKLVTKPVDFADLTVALTSMQLRRASRT